MDRYDVAVVGAGVVGLACAWSAARAGARVLLLERNDGPGLEQSTHNSQVIHSGAFSAPGTLRAQLGLRGRQLLYEWAPRWGVPVDPCGTMVAALTPQERPRLERYEAWARENVVDGVRRIGPREARELEPHLGEIEAGLWVGSGGRVDAPGLVAALEREARSLGVSFRYGFDLVSSESAPRGRTLTSRSGDAAQAGRVVNAAGVGSGRVARILGAVRTPRVYPCLGEYLRVRGAKSEWVRSMIYGFPPPGYPGIGVHLTKTLSGDLLIGPTARYIEGEQPPATPVASIEELLAPAQRLVPGLGAEDVVRHPAGVRAKLVPPGSAEAFGDFGIEEDPPGEGALHLLGIESPGLTASLAIGERVAGWCAGRP